MFKENFPTAHLDKVTLLEILIIVKRRFCNRVTFLLPPWKSHQKGSVKEGKQILKQSDLICLEK